MRLEPRDGVAIEGVREVTVKALADCEAVLVETPVNPLASLTDS